MKKVILAFGTRPEATKMALIYHALKALPGIEPHVVLTGQHREQLQHGLSIFKVPATANLDVMVERQTLPELFARILPQAAKKLKELQADYVLVHGDTLTTFAVTWAAFLEGIPVGHVEAGLRSFNFAEPFPEEANRRLTDVLTDLDLAPTALSKKNLLHEGKPDERILITGQTGVDHVLYASKHGSLPEGLPPGPYVSVTLHRRENWPVMGEFAQALAKAARAHPNFTFVFPVHLNPTVREAVFPMLKPVPNFVLLDPLDYAQMAPLLAQSYIAITDSGGIQEEGAALGVPVIVPRNVTERPEGVEAGILKLAGTDPQRLFELVDQLLSNPAERARMAASKNPYGDGQACQRVAQGVAWRLGLAERPEDWQS